MPSSSCWQERVPTTISSRVFSLRLDGCLGGPFCLLVPCSPHRGVHWPEHPLFPLWLFRKQNPVGNSRPGGLCFSRSLPPPPGHRLGRFKYGRITRRFFRWPSCLKFSPPGPCFLWSPGRASREAEISAIIPYFGMFCVYNNRGHLLERTAYLVISAGFFTPANRILARRDLTPPGFLRSGGALLSLILAKG